MQFGTTLTSPTGYTALSGATATYTLASQTGLSGSVTGTHTVSTTTSLEGSGITKADLINASDDFDAVGNNLVYNVPDAAALSSSDCRAVYAAFIAASDARGDSFVVLDTPANLDPTSAQSFAADITPKSNSAAVYYPWLNIADPTQSGTPATRKVPPGGSVVGLILQTDASRGVFKAPAGLGSSLSNIISTERMFSSSDLDALNTALTPVNVIRQVPGAGICVMGARNVGADRRMKYVSTRRTMLQVKKRLADLTAFAVFEPNDERLWEHVRNTCGSYLRELWQQGGLKGATQTDAYFVKCDATNNTATSRADGELNIEVGVALQTPAEFVIIRIGQFDGAASINVQ
jgi:phage tail sheath protein FI